MFERDYLNLKNHLKNSIVILINRKKCDYENLKIKSNLQFKNPFSGILRNNKK